MKILNLGPITILKYISTKENLDKAIIPSLYESQFSFEGRKIGSLNTMFVSFSIEYYGGHTNDHIFSYESCTAFDFLREGYDTDLKSLVQFIADYYKHTELFLRQFGVITQKQIEKSMGLNGRSFFEKIANDAIDNLRANNLYD